MKRFFLFGFVVAILHGASASAQSCASPVTTWRPDSGGVPALTGNTCDASSETGILSLCEGASDGHQHAYVVVFTSVAAGTYTTISLNNTDFTGYMAVVSTAAAGACNGSGDTGHCVTNGDAATPIQHVNVPEGTYYLIVSNSGVDPDTACGPFTLTGNGFLPVTLQTFTVS